MHNLGSTRSAHQHNHLLQTPDTFVRTTIPCLRNGLAIVHIAPSGGAAFAQYTVEMAAGGELLPSGADRFLYCLEGSLDLTAGGATHHLEPGGYAHLPGDVAHRVTTHAPARAAVIEHRYSAPESATATVRRPFIGSEDAQPSLPLDGAPGVFVRSLLPPSDAFDLAVNVMTYQPGASLSMVEVHVMEHGLLMLAGGGVYRLGNAWYPVAAGDFIWMAPFCPQWFGALGELPTRYLIYKDANRHPLLP